MKVDIRALIEDAASKEDEAQHFYLNLMETARDPSARKLLSELAADEKQHAKILRGGDVEAFLKTQPPAIQDLRITEFLAPKKLTPNGSFQDVLIHAMKREDASFWAYRALSESTDDNTAQRLFRRLADEERAHRNKLEKLYDDVIFAED